ncbi:MAG: deoxyribonuclease IV [Oscillospiraceae bacterium]|jgi:deoxyribonuclease-4|nr:deoxyribonuclease IV [Oscillospiraceae bacterium]
MFLIGCHLTVADGFAAMARSAAALGATTFQFFSRNPRGGSAKDWKPADIAEFAALCAAHGIAQPLAHAPYTINPAAEKPNVREFARTALREDLTKLEAVNTALTARSGAVAAADISAKRSADGALPEPARGSDLPGQPVNNASPVMYNLHPGSHVGQGADVGISLTAQCLNEAVPDGSVPVLLETMAGKGSELGGTFAELRQIIDRAENVRDRLGVCLDTCHVYDAGYDVAGDLDGVLREFDREIGLDRLRAVHLNDSKNPFASHRDRHEVIGGGSLGLETFRNAINHPLLRGLPFYLETPNDLDGYAREITLLTGMRE